MQEQAELKKTELIRVASIVLKHDEGDGLPGRSGKPYRDTNGYWTIGHGHYIGTTLEALYLSPAVMSLMLIEDIESHLPEAIKIVGEHVFSSLTTARKVALLSMVYTLGRNKFLQFAPTIDAIKAGRWDEVSSRILKSKWATDVDPKKRDNEGRDDRIAYMFRTGELHPDYC